MDFTPRDRFSLVRQLGSGGMGVVYEALDRKRNALVALKTLPSVDRASVYALKAEFRVLADIAHPNIVALHELFVDDRTCFFTMDLVDGVDLLSWVRAGLVQPRGDAATTQELPMGKPEACCPEAVSGLEPVSGPFFDEHRLRSALRQLAAGLCAIHAAGKVHCDVKPNNILVTPDGHVVLLDFGLTLEAGRERSDGITLVGTPLYMAPEQARGLPVTAASDWYAVGVVLYEALAGREPFPGTALQALSRKLFGLPVPPGDVAVGVPGDLERVCMALLAQEPSSRPSGEVVRRLGTDSGVWQVDRGVPEDAALFVGRSTELSLLREAWRDTCRGRTVSVMLRGPSGVGKTAIVRQFLTELRRETPDALIFDGRCYEREYVPFKAMDGVIETMAGWLALLGDVGVRALAGRDTFALLRVFPAFEAVAAFRDPLQPRRPLGAQDVRIRAFSALRELLVGLVSWGPVVLVVDDLQWADADSLALLGAVLRPPRAPALLFVATTRGATVRDGVGDCRVVEVGPLGATESAELARLWLNDAADVVETSAAIGRESGGHPLFVAELVRQVRAEPERVVGGAALDEALWGRISRLEQEHRGLLTAVAIAGAPIDYGVAADAAGLDPKRALRVFLTLRADRLLSSAPQGEGAVETTHDRVREVVEARVGPSDRRRLHRALAEALEARGQGDPQTLARHWEEAGERQRAAELCGLAAEQAMAAAAFDQAARFYRKAIELESSEGRKRELVPRLGEAYAAGGMGAEAARCFLEAASSEREERGIDLRRRAAEQLLRCGQLAEGMELLRAVLRSVGLRMPRRRWSAILSLQLHRFRLRLRGLGFRERPRNAIPSQQLLRIDTCWAAGLCLGMVDAVLGADFMARHALLALRAGERHRALRALALESFFLHGLDARYRARARALAERLRPMVRGEAYLEAFAKVAEGLQAYQESRFADAYPSLRRAEQQMQEVAGVAYEVASARLYLSWTLFYLGRYAELSDRVHRDAQEALQRGDKYAWTHTRLGLPCFVRLMDDAPEEARREADEAFRGWSFEGFNYQAYFHMVGSVCVALYEGDGDAAMTLFEAQWPRLRSNPILRYAMVDFETSLLHAWSALLTAQTLPGSRPERLQQALRDARRMEASGLAAAAASRLCYGLAWPRWRGKRTKRCSLQARRSSCWKRRGCEGSPRLRGGAGGTCRGDALGKRTFVWPGSTSCPSA